MSAIIVIYPFPMPALCWRTKKLFGRRVGGVQISVISQDDCRQHFSILKYFVVVRAFDSILISDAKM